MRGERQAVSDALKILLEIADNGKLSPETIGLTESVPEGEGAADVLRRLATHASLEGDKSANDILEWAKARSHFNVKAPIPEHTRLADVERAVLLMGLNSYSASAKKTEKLAVDVFRGLIAMLDKP